MQRISMIVAVARGGVIGFKNSMPWGRLPEDLKRFKRLTDEKAVVMGRKTYESIFAELGKPLPNRLNIVLTKNIEFTAPGCSMVNSREAALRTARIAGKDIVVIGGEGVYRQFLPIAHIIYLTEIDGEFRGDKFFPPLDMKKWLMIGWEKKLPDEKHRWSITFKIFKRK